MSAFAESLLRLNRIPGVRGSMIVAAEDGLVVEADLMIGIPGPAVAALAASLFRGARRSLAEASLGDASFLQLEAEGGYLFAAAPPTGDLMLAVVSDDRVNVGMLRLEAAAVAETLG
jgi:predicted regulator of Ras-like GTPase activity (Roadblock/LC7/MglB family)